MTRWKVMIDGKEQIVSSQKLRAIENKGTDADFMELLKKAFKCDTLDELTEAYRDIESRRWTDMERHYSRRLRRGLNESEMVASRYIKDVCKELNIDIEGQFITKLKLGEDGKRKIDKTKFKSLETYSLEAKRDYKIFLNRCIYKY